MLTKSKTISHACMAMQLAYPITAKICVSIIHEYYRIQQSKCS